MQIFGGFFRNVGLVLATLIWIVVTYEIAGLVLDSVPTLSRVMQGWRDAGRDELVWGISAVLVCIFALFGAWLYYHLNYEVRSGN